MARKPSPLNKAKAIVGAQYAPIDHAIAVAQKQSAAQQQALNAARLALVQQLQQGVAPAGQVYDSAVQQQQALAQSGAKLLSDANPNQGLQQNLQAIGAPPEQQAQLASSLQSLFPGAGSVLNVQEGTIPGASLLAQKAATQGYLAGLPTVAALSGEQSLRGLLASAADTRNKLLEQRLQVGGQLPALAQTLAQQGVENAQADRSFNQQARQYQQTQAFNARQNELDRIAQQALTPYQKASLELDQRKLNADIAASKLTTANGGLTAYQSASLNERKREFNARQGVGNGGSGLTPYERYGAFEKTRSKVRQALGLEQAPGAGSIFAGTSQSSLNVPKGQRRQAYNRLYSTYAGSLLRAGVSKNSVKAMLNTALNEAGYALPGKKVNAQGQPVGP